MKIYNINPFTPNFNGKRQDRKTITQLKEDNKYNLNDINQKRISKAIDNLANEKNEETANFLLDVSENLKYRTNIDLGKTPYNDWRVKLNKAAEKAVSESPIESQKRILSKIEQISRNKSLSKEEIEILELKKSLLAQIDKEQLKNIKNNNIKQLERNLDYFIISSEVSTAQKLYIMKRLNYFISPEYKINSQLKDRKTQALAEIINDIVVNTPESKIPNIKTTNQQQHGMCAAISISRKALAYEDKANFVDMIISELDDTDYLEVYDITKLGTNTKTKIAKTKMDFDYALSKGYRIIDTSALFWMHVADTAGATNELAGMYCPFDKENFDALNDTHFMPNLSEKNLIAKQDYYRTLLKSKKALSEYKKAKDKNSKSTIESLENFDNLVQYQTRLNKLVKNILLEISPTLSEDKAKTIVKDLSKLEISTSEKAAKVNDYTRNFVYLPNESDQAKKEKIKAFLSIALPDKNAQILDKNATKLLRITNSINELNNKNTSNYISRNYRKAHNLYNIASAYRTQYKFAMEIPEIVDDYVVDLHLPDRETRIIKNMDYLIKKLEKGEKLHPKIMETLAENFNCDNDPEIILEALQTNNDSMKYIMTDLLDDFYKAILCTDRKTNLRNEIINIRKEIKEGENKEYLSILSENFHVGKDNKKAVLKILDKYIEKLESNDCSNEEYLKIYHHIGKTNQMMDFKEKIELLINIMFEQDPPNENIIKGFNALHGLPEDAPLEQTKETLLKVAQKFDEISLITTNFQNALEVRDDNGDILNTVIAKSLVLKKLENMGEIPSKKDLRMLQEKFTKISEYRMDEDGKDVKLKDLPDELKFYTKHEKEILKSYDSKVNQWYSKTIRELNKQYRELRDPLNELHRQVGVKIGDRYVSEGETGLTSTQQVKIFEHMTDRPYYTEYNTKFAIEKLKNSPYSGISSTSVDNKTAAWHAQYIADIKEMPIKNGVKTEMKDVMFHDNTWGPIEHDNTWIDEYGVKRTDYQRNYGGAVGYVTDDKYRNGKLVENLLDEVGKMRFNETEEYMFPMLKDVILSGRHPKANSQVIRIRQNTLQNPLIDFKDFEKIASTMTKEEIQGVINKTKDLGKNSYNEFLDIQRRVFGNPPFNKGIRTKETYDKLPDNDNLKILFEKIALLESYNQIPDLKVFYKTSSMDELNKTKQIIKNIARKNFDYAFAKNPEIVNFGAESVRKKTDELLNQFALENTLKLTLTQKEAIINSLKQIRSKEFDGNLEKTIELMTNSFTQALMKKTPDFENKQEKIEILANNVRELLRTNMGFTLADLNSSSSATKIPTHITNWVDNVFSPSTDEEFVQIFKKLQNMTTKEFNNKYGSFVNNAALNINQVSGFEIVQQFLKMNEKTENMLFNLIFFQDFGYNLNMGETKTVYDLNKFNKVARGAIYEKGKKTFDDIYMDYYYSLSSLTMHKHYEKYRQQLFDKQNIFLAYPKIDLEDKKEVEEIIDVLYKDIEESIESISDYKNKVETFDIADDLAKFSKELNPYERLSTEQRKFIDDKLNRFLEMNETDETIINTVNAAISMLELSEDSIGADFITYIRAMNDELSLYNTTMDGKTMQDSVNIEMERIAKIRNAFVKNVFAPKHYSKAYELIDNYIKARVKGKQNADEYFENFERFYNRNRVILKPENMLNEYLLLLAKQDTQKLTDAEIKQIDETKYVFKHNIQGLISLSNILELQQILMDCAKEGNLNIVKDELKKSQIELKNGQIVSLDSDLGLNIILMPMLANMDIDTAIMFIEQLGLAERVVEMNIKDTNFKKMYHNIKRIDNILSAVNKQIKIAREEVEKLGNIDKDPDYINKINQARENIKKRFKNTNYRKTTKMVDVAFDEILKDIANNPNRSKLAIIYLYLDNLKTGSIFIAKNDAKKLNDVLEAYQQMENLVRRLKIPENSYLKEQKEKYFKEIEKVEQYVHEHSRNYEEIDVSTELESLI